MVPGGGLTPFLNLNQKGCSFATAFQTVEKLYYHPTWGVVRGESPSDLKMRFSRACTAKTAPIKGWRGERRASLGIRESNPIWFK